MKIGRKVLPHGGNGKLLGGIPIMRLHNKDGLDTDRTGKPVIISESSIYLWHESHKRIWCTIYSDYIGDIQRSSLSPTGGVKSTSPVTENHYKNGFVNYKNFIRTNEDNNRDTMYTINKNDTNNHDTRDMHK